MPSHSAIPASTYSGFRFLARPGVAWSYRSLGSSSRQAIGSRSSEVCILDIAYSHPTPGLRLHVSSECTIPTMPASRSVRRSTTEKACNECQRRKTKCVLSQDGPCDFCRRAGKACVFDEPPQRTPLTRQNLDQAEARCRQLEQVLQQRETEMTPSAASRHDQQQPKLRANESGDGNADYEWNEASDPEAREHSSDSDHARDGMAALTSRNSGSGYLGIAVFIGILFLANRTCRHKLGS